MGRLDRGGSGWRVMSAVARRCNTEERREDAEELWWLLLDRSSLDRTVKALDVCNGITHGVEAIQHAQKLAEVTLLALEHRPFAVGFDKFGLG
ncbi:hypothetical protein Droror1_Dr00007363 [Drosera rotundifolia]